MKVFASIIIDVRADQLWPVLRDFVGLTTWSNAVSAAHITNGKAPDQVGAIRHLDIVDGSVFVETLVALSDELMSLSYNIVEGPLPVTDYVATMRVYPVTASACSYVTWSAEFDTPESEAEAMREVVGEQICAGGLQAMKAFFESA
jgi:hypothetical protein